MDLDYYENLSDDGALHKWPRDGSKLRAGPQGDREDKNGHAGYAASLLERVQAKAGEIDAALQAQGLFRHTSQFAKDNPLMRILSAFAEVAAHMDDQWKRHQDGQLVAIIDGDGRNLIDQATSHLHKHMKSYKNALDGNRIDDPLQSDLPANVSEITADSLKVNAFLFAPVTAGG